MLTIVHTMLVLSVDQVKKYYRVEHLKGPYTHTLD
jgi:hypothetical protein